DAGRRALAKRRRRPLLNPPPPRSGEGQGGGSLFLIAADHPARGVLKVGADPMAMADRGELLRRLLTALGRPGVDGILGTADIIDDLALLGALDGKVVFWSMNRADADSLIRAVTIVSGLGTTSAYLWLKLPVVDDLDRVMRATSLPTLLLGGDPGDDPQETFATWERAMAIPQVRGLVAGRTLL